MSDKKFYAKILKVKSHVDDFGNLFEQELLVEARNREKFWIFDVSLLCNKQMEGKTSIIEFNVWHIPAQKNLSKIHDNVKKIKPPEKLCVHNIPDYSAVFYGEIVDKYQTKYNVNFSLDVGSGIVEILVDDIEYNKYSIGDYIKIEGNIVQLSEIECT
jgi:hypothetical protein